LNPSPQPSGTGGRPSALSLWGPVTLYAAAIFAASSIHHPPDLPSGISDKHVHALLYAGLSLVVLRACAGGRLSGVSLATWAIAIALTVAYGATDEFHQRFVAGRTADLADLAADAVGAVVATTAALAAARLGKSRPGTRI
jgi:VanZ family protein